MVDLMPQQTARLAQANNMRPEDVLASRPFYCRGSALELWNASDLEILHEGPAGTGKTLVDLTKMYATCLTWPEARCLVLRQTRRSMNNTVIPMFEEQVLPANSALKCGGKYESVSDYQFPNKSVMVMAGMKSGSLDVSEAVMSSQWDVILFVEALEAKIGDYEKLLTRLRNYKTGKFVTRNGKRVFDGLRQIIMECNPGPPQHWLNHRSSMRRIKSKHIDNPLYFDIDVNDWTDYGRDYMATLEATTGVRRKRLFAGDWAAAEGAVFLDVWSPERHIIDELPNATTMEYFILCKDWGYNPDPGVSLLIGVNSANVAFVYRQEYRTMLELDEWVEIDKKHVQWVQSMGKRFVGVIGDKSRPEFLKTYERKGIGASIEANNDILFGISTIAGALKNDKLYVGRDSLYESDRELRRIHAPICLQDEMDMYAYAEDVANKSSGIARSKPVDKYNHAIDALRYGMNFVNANNGGSSGSMVVDYDTWENSQ